MVAMNPKQTFMDKIKKGNTSLFVNPNIPVKKFAPTDAELSRFIGAIRHNETRGVKGDPYAFKQPAGGGMGMARGAYQFTDEGMRTDVNRGIINQTTAANMDMPAAQDIYMKNIYRHYTKLGYTPQQIADIHRKGFKNSDVPGGTRYQSPGYVAEFNKAYQPQPPAVAQITR